MGYGKGLFDPKSHNFYQRKKNDFLRHLHFFGVLLHIMLCMYTSQIGNFITFLLVVITCQNSYFSSHYSHFSVTRLNLPMVI